MTLSRAFYVAAGVCFVAMAFEFKPFGPGGLGFFWVGLALVMGAKASS